MTPQKPLRGLPSIHKGREERARGKFARPAGATYLYVALLVVGSIFVYRFVADRQLAVAKAKLLAGQRATEEQLGARWFPLRDRIEATTVAAARSYAGDRVDPIVRTWDFRSMPGIYLRLRAAEAQNIASLRTAAGESARDGFVGCLLRPGAAPAADGGAFPDQPWNLRQAYGAARVLSPEWVASVKDANDDLRLRVFAQQYAKANTQEIPAAVDIVTRARFFLLVLDEDVDAARDVARDRADGGSAQVTMEALQLVPHPSRVHVVNLKTGDEVLRLRRTGEASFVMAGERAVVDAETRDAMQRQVNNCSLAQQVQEAIDGRGAAAP